ncbi:hypothetical protein OV079_26965 [Nannocystis pusilla]|uniref:Metallo-beta-lactamase domain-containing protein n=1 Tax=Nannocystis pusilla TaxID=889268 RepID=A0A9X3ESI3_9BACT|nr:hypothetical protein [Nannocystis pusilla]MCY1009140.1 hypothetical protein [Nannocystis pusilla]
MRYADYREFAGVLLPARRTERWLHDDAADTRDLPLELVERVSHEDLAPAEAETHWLPLAGTDPSPAPRPPAKIVALSPALFLVELPLEDTRAAFAVFDDFVVVLDAPLRSAAGEDLLAAVRAHAPDKEIRYAVFGHHHPHYSGGLRPLIHAGATIVTTAGNVPLIEDLARRPHALAPDALAREPRAPKFLVVDGRHVFSDASGRALELHDIGAYTEHTDSYLVYYFPRERLRVEGDLAGSLSRARCRARGRRRWGSRERSTLSASTWRRSSRPGRSRARCRSPNERSWMRSSPALGRDERLHLTSGTSTRDAARAPAAAPTSRRRRDLAASASARASRRRAPGPARGPALGPAPTSSRASPPVVRQIAGTSVDMSEETDRIARSRPPSRAATRA